MALKLRIVVVGLGSIGRRHARLLAERPDTVVEWCETDAAALEFARKELVPPAVCHASFEAALATRPDAVVIATPHTAHEAPTVAALRAGVHVLCEKPMADTLAAAQRMARTARESDRVLAFGFQLHFNPGLQRLKALIAGGELGKLVHFHCRVGSYVTLMNSRSRHQQHVRGALLMDYTHQPDLLHWILGEEPVGVYAAGGTGGDLELSSAPNFLSITCDYARPYLGTIHLNYVQLPERHEYEVVGDRGWVIYDHNAGVMRRGERAGARAWNETFPTERDLMYRAEHQNFIAAITTGATVESPAQSALVSMRIIDAALASWRTQTRVKLADTPEA
jgi:predicted dehydrogenase